MSGFAIERADFYTFSGENVTTIVGLGSLTRRGWDINKEKWVRLVSLCRRAHSRL